MAKDKQNSSGDQDPGDLASLNEAGSAGAAPDNAALIAAQARIAELEAKLAAASRNTGSTGVNAAAPAEGEATYYHQQGNALVGTKVIVAGGILYHPQPGENGEPVVLVRGAKASDKPANGCYVRA